MVEFRLKTDIPTWKPAVMDNLGDDEFLSFKEFCKSKDKENEVLYCLIRSRMGIIYSSKKAEDIENKGVSAFDIDDFGKIVDKVAKKFKLNLFSESLEQAELDYKSIQYSIRETEVYAEKDYYSTMMLTSSIYSTEEWHKIQAYFEAIDEKEKKYELVVMPEHMSYLDKEGYYITIIVTDISKKYDRIED